MVLLSIREYLGREMRYVQAGVSSAWNKINPAMVKKPTYDRKAPLWTGLRGGGGFLSADQVTINKAFGALAQSVPKGPGTLMKRIDAIRDTMRGKKAGMLTDWATRYAKVAKPVRYAKPRVPVTEVKKIFA